jgi:uncharacterized protein (TIGR03435 family)
MQLARVRFRRSLSASALALLAAASGTPCAHAQTAIAVPAQAATPSTPAFNTAPPPAIPDTPSALSFEVASIKRSAPPEAGMMGTSFGRNGRFVLPQQSLMSLISLAYGVRPYQLIGGPPWLRSERFDINAKAEDGAVLTGPIPSGDPKNPAPLQLMVQSLLRERFALRVHVESREMQIATLLVARKDGRLGERLTPAKVDCLARGRGGAAAAPPTPGDCNMRGGLGTIMGRGMPIAMIANMLSGLLDRPVFDRTGLTGPFNYDVEYTPDRMPTLAPGATLPPGFTMPSPDGPSLTTALQEQLGLKIEHARGPVDVLVIDAAEPPTPD